jgi:C-terminal processing protease CtpA/Prc
LGISAPSGGGQGSGSGGRLGLRFDAAEFEQHGVLRISEVIPLGPAALAGGVQAGMNLAAVDGLAIGKNTNLDELLDHKRDKRVVLSLTSGDKRSEVAVRPITMATEKFLTYKDWVDQRREYVSKASGGRLGYIHMQDMTSRSLEQLYMDLDADNHAREGVIIDLRNNNGGFVNAYALDVLARRPYLNMTMRGWPTAPARTVLGQRALELPTILVTNQHSLSDAEDFTEGYRSLGLGKVVGEPTAGWIIYTWGTQLLDGSSVRLPRVRITTRDGQDMEMHPRPVDVQVTRPIGESGRDSQLDAAVKELLAQIGGK